MCIRDRVWVERVPVPAMVPPVARIMMRGSPSASSEERPEKTVKRMTRMKMRNVFNRRPSFASSFSSGEDAGRIPQRADPARQY
jgi:hypothetical protein